MKINSLQDLKNIRQAHPHHSPLPQTEILVGMATCGISAGARDTYKALNDEITKQGIANARIVPVGCIGCCHAEPTVQINITGQKPVLYGHVTKDNVPTIIEQHLKNGKLAEDLVIPLDFDRA